MIMGPQGCGKGTQAELLAKRFKLIHVSTGDLLREEKGKGSELGKEIGRLIDKGNHVSDEIIFKLVKEKIKNQENYILDGFPRNMEQVEMSKDLEFDKVIYLTISDKTVLDRLGGRRNCKKCGKVYHIEYKKPKEEGKCDKCKGELYVREDEKKGAVVKRLKLYKEKTEPVIEYYKNKGKVMEVDGERGIEEIHEDIKQRLER